MPNYFNTVAGHKFTEATLPRLIDELSRFNTTVQSASNDFLPELKRFNDNMEEYIELQKEGKRTASENRPGDNPGAEEALREIARALTDKNT